MLKHFIYLSFNKLTTSSDKSTTSFLCSLYYRYSSKLSSFFCILSFLVKAIFIDQTFYSAMHYLAAVWLDSRHDFNIKLRIHLSHDINFIIHSSHLYRWIKSKEICLSDDSILKDKNNIREFIESMKTYNHWIARRFIAHSICIHSKSINRIYDKELRELLKNQLILMKQMSENKLFNSLSKSSWISWVKIICVIKFNSTQFESRSI